jgi:hypothetical protein
MYYKQMNDRIEWHDLGSEERAALTEDQVRDYCRIAAMGEGVVLSPIQPSYLPEVKPEVSEVEAWVIEADNMPQGIAFTTQEDARAFLRLGVLAVDSKYLGGDWRTSVNVIRPMVGMTVAKKDDFVTETEYNRTRASLDEYGNNAKHNRELREANDKRDREYRSACEYVWSDYREAKKRIEKLAEVRRCWAEYQELAKDKASAVTFMLKAYKDSDILNEALGATWNVQEAEACSE